MNQKQKIERALRRQSRAQQLIKQGLQLMNWSIVKLDENVFVFGKKEMCFLVREIIDEQTKQQAPEVNPTSSLELSASGKDDSNPSSDEATAGQETGDAAAISEVGAASEANGEAS